MLTSIPRAVRILGHLKSSLSYGARGASQWEETTTPRNASSSSVGRAIVVRLADPSDTEAIRVLSKRSLGDSYPLDYLQGWLPRAFLDPNRTIVVAEHEGRIVGLLMAIRGVDDNTSVAFESARVDPDYNSLGLIGRCFAVCVTEIVRRGNDFLRTRGSSIQTQFMDKLPHKFNILAKRTYVQLKVLKHCLPKGFPFRGVVPVGITQYSSERFQSLLQDKAINRALFPDGVIGVAFDVFNSLASNVPFITYFHPHVFVSDDQRSLSIGGMSLCDDDRAWRYSFTFYGRSDINTCALHLVEHLRLCERSLRDRDLYLVMFMPRALKNLYGKETIRHYLEDVFGTDSLEDFKIHTQYQYDHI